jgi:carboxymethylenebutenolidase
MKPISQDIINLYDSFTHGLIGRRAFMEKLTGLAGTSAAAAGLAALLKNDYAKASIIADDDVRLSVSQVSFPAAGGEVQAYLAKPTDDAKRAAVIVIHENRGLNAHIKDVARRVALEGFIALAPDLLSVSGGTPADEDKARDMLAGLDANKTLAELVAAVDYLRGLPGSTGKVGAVGFCWGGGMTNLLATRAPGLSAAVAYYGSQPSAAEADKIKASLMLHYAGLDERTNAGIPAYEEALKAAKVDYQIFIYEGAQHAFNNDTSAARYDKKAADLAWGRTIAFLKTKLG